MRSTAKRSNGQYRNVYFTIRRGEVISQFHMHKSQPIGAALPLPVGHDIEVMQAVSVHLYDTTDVALVNVFIRLAAHDGHADLKDTRHNCWTVGYY